MINCFFDLDAITRFFLSFIISALLIIMFGGVFIKLIKNYTQPIREDGMETHFSKANTPTFGGVLMVIVFILNVIVWVKFNILVLSVLISALGFAAIGFVDDFLKLKSNTSRGLGVKVRLFAGFLIGVIVAYINTKVYEGSIGTSVYFPFVKYFYINLHIFIYLWIALVILGVSNAVNLTDGLDGLATLVVFVIMLTIGIVIALSLHYLGGNNLFNHTVYSLTSVGSKVKEILVIVGIIMGILMGFLWYNAPKAKVFMGDVGSLFLGGALGGIVIAIKYELILLISGLILVLEALSVIIQVYYYKATKKRFFLMAPLHHHFEKMGQTEVTVTLRFVITTVLLSALTLFLIIM